MNPFDDAALTRAAGMLVASARQCTPETAVKRKAAAKAVLNGVKEHGDLHTRFLEQTTENILLHFELGKIRDALVHARDTRGPGFLIVKLDLETVDALLARQLPAPLTQP